jgi:plasmid stabilization system protein ParE
VKIRFANTAKISLHSAINFIHQDNPTAAANFLGRVEKTLRRLEKYPDSGRRIPEYPDYPTANCWCCRIDLFIRSMEKLFLLLLSGTRHRYL